MNRVTVALAALILLGGVPVTAQSRPATPLAVQPLRGCVLRPER